MHTLIALQKIRIANCQLETARESRYLPCLLLLLINMRSFLKRVIALVKLIDELQFNIVIQAACGVSGRVAKAYHLKVPNIFDVWVSIRVGQHISLKMTATACSSTSRLADRR